MNKWMTIYDTMLEKCDINDTKTHHLLWDYCIYKLNNELWMSEDYLVLQQEQYSFVWEQFDFLFEALDSASLILWKVDLSEASTVKIRCIIHPGLTQRRLGSVLIPSDITQGKTKISKLTMNINVFSQKRKI